MTKYYNSYVIVLHHIYFRFLQHRSQRQLDMSEEKFGEVCRTFPHHQPPQHLRIILIRTKRKSQDNKMKEQTNMALPMMGGENKRPIKIQVLILNTYIMQKMMPKCVHLFRLRIEE